MSRLLEAEKHILFIQKLDKAQTDLEYWLTEHLRISGIYWGLVALETLDNPLALEKDKVIEYVKSCQNQDGGFGGHTGHDSHLLYTMSAVQILAIYNRLEDINKDAVLKYVKGLQNKTTGYMMGDIWGEMDTRFAFIGLAICNILGSIDTLRIEPIVEYIEKSMNYDGGFGSGPGGESHAAQVYTCLAALAIAKRLDLVKRDRLSNWLCERQQSSSGGLNGRPEKLPDSCYSWWVVSSLEILGRRSWIDAEKLQTFILNCQDPDNGGISDRPENYADVYHTCFGIAGLSLLKYNQHNLKLNPIDPIYCMPYRTVEALGLRSGPKGWCDYVPKSWV
ncbi:hypothetical protein BB561_005500 [Smittium simulii]|uniref:Geranylgeranyl transferase type-2 subunit beta n=1 Tax=Smittium simulii TaxID=133385 RepID=A0A2T9YA30_9FUNG|nr:hypothetical protein BB561_005500 [Smittium simulii]